MAYTTINKSTEHFNTKLYAGNGTDDHAITGVDFQPDLTWLKTRASGSHYWFDNVRGATKFIKSDSTDAEGTASSTLKSFDTDGFTLGTSGAINSGTENFASWNWLASNTTASNTDGSITSTVSANTTSGFSIVSWSGTGANATVGHSLGVTPSMIIVKNRGAGEIWVTYDKTNGATKYLSLNSSIASTTDSTIWNNTEPTSSVFSVGTSERSNRNGYDMIAYCFAEKKGFSKFGSYTGNGSTDGTFVYTGFKPAFVMIKRTGGVQDWIILDNKRPEYNETNRALYANANYDDTGTDKGIDILSNGFKLRKNHEAINYSENYIYMAFGQSLVGSNNVPCTAR